MPVCFIYTEIIHNFHQGERRLKRERTQEQEKTVEENGREVKIIIVNVTVTVKLKLKKNIFYIIIKKNNFSILFQYCK